MRLACAALVALSGLACSAPPLSHDPGGPVPTVAPSGQQPSGPPAGAVDRGSAAVGASDPSADADAGDRPDGATAPDAGVTGVPLAHGGPLASFYDALRDLECGRREQHVRIAWLGDSHAQADFWTGRLRRGLQQRFGNAGPGFVHLGFREYRHDGMRVLVHGKWYQRPKRIATTKRYKEGILGLGGILSTGYADKPRASLTLTDAEHAGRKLRWELCYQVNERADEFRVTITGSKRRTVGGQGRLGSLRHLELEAQGLATLEVRPTKGRPMLCGVVVETQPTEQLGVVLDNLGINGARYATALAWNAVHWGAELSRRSPELVVLEYGGNEASDFQSRPEAYQRHLERLVARVRKIRPGVACLVIGLADRADAESRIAAIRDAQRAGAQAAGCGFWDTYELMGGKGSLRRWRDEKKAAEDGVHLMPRGYEELGDRLLADLMADYHPGCADE